jgi:hypothetical protein
MDVFGHMDGMTFMDEIDQHPYILIWLTRPNVTVLSDQIHQLKFFIHAIQLILSILYVSVTHVVGPIHPDCVVHFHPLCSNFRSRFSSDLTL